jgi:hypothetical protein
MRLRAAESFAAGQVCRDGSLGIRADIRREELLENESNLATLLDEIRGFYFQKLAQLRVRQPNYIVRMMIDESYLGGSRPREKFLRPFGYAKNIGEKFRLFDDVSLRRVEKNGFAAPIGMPLVVGIIDAGEARRRN